MSNLITVKVDVRKLDTSRYFEGKPDKDGHRPLYADLVLIARREPGKYGDTHIVKQSVTKEEREAKVEMPIIGSATERGGYGSSAPANRPQTETTITMNGAAPVRRPTAAPLQDPDSDQVPF